MSRILVMIALAAASLAAKDRVYQTGTLLDKSLNPYIRTTESGDSGTKSNEFMNGTVMVAVNSNRSAGAVSYEDYVVEVADTVYLIEVAHMKTFKAPRLSLSRPLNVAVEKNKLFIKDLDNSEYSGDIIKQVSKSGQMAGEQLASVQANPAPVAKSSPAAKADTAPPSPKTQEAKAPVAAPPVAKTPSKPQPVAVSLVQVATQPTAVVQTAPPPPAPKPAPKAEAPKVEAAITKVPEKPAATGLATPKDPKPAPKAEAPKVEAPKVQAVVTKPVERPAPTPKPESVRQESPAASRAPVKDRAWQGGQLLSIVNNNYFFNVTYSADTEGASWPFTQGSDGRYTVNGQIANPTNSLYTYDNYCIESQFVVYLVQRMRPKTSPPVRLPGTQALKFAVEKNKLWVMDEQNIEYEMKVVKLVQKETIVDPLTRAAARN